MGKHFTNSSTDSDIKNAHLSHTEHFNILLRTRINWEKWGKCNNLNNTVGDLSQNTLYLLIIYITSAALLKNVLEKLALSYIYSTK